jgi:menaquinol-cytochrome c reductase iron-sulfur subunit
MAEPQDSRRGFLKIATVAIGGVMGAVVAFPLIRYVLFPVRQKVVSAPSEPLDVLDVGALQPGAPPVRVQMIASNVRDGWAVADDVPLGAAWVRKTETGDIEALSSVCPHLGCAVDFDREAALFKCPCHKSAFAPDGTKLSGPSKRGLDPLPVRVEGGRVKITFLRYRADVPEREPV